MMLKRDECKHDKGWRYASTVRRTKETIANGKAGKVVLICKSCPQTKVV